MFPNKNKNKESGKKGNGIPSTKYNGNGESNFEKKGRSVTPLLVSPQVTENVSSTIAGNNKVGLFPSK